MISMKNTFATLLVLAGCGGSSAPAPQTTSSAPVVVAHETRSSSTGTSADDEHTCDHPEKDSTIREAKGLMEQKKFAEASAVLEAAVSANPDHGKAWQLYGFALHADGKLDQALTIHEKAATFPDQRAISLYNIACVHALQGRADKAFASLDEAIAAGFSMADHIEKDPDLTSLRADPRFAAVVKGARDNPQVARKSGDDGHSCEHEGHAH